MMFQSTRKLDNSNIIFKRKILQHCSHNAYVLSFYAYFGYPNKLSSGIGCYSIQCLNFEIIHVDNFAEL